MVDWGTFEDYDVHSGYLLACWNWNKVHKNVFDRKQTAAKVIWGNFFLLRGTAEKLKILPDGAKVAVYVIKYRVFLAFVFVTSNNSMHRCVMAQQMLIELISRVMAMGDIESRTRNCP